MTRKLWLAIAMLAGGVALLAATGIAGAGDGKPAKSPKATARRVGR